MFRTSQQLRYLYVQRCRALSLTASLPLYHNATNTSTRLVNPSSRLGPSPLLNNQKYWLSTVKALSSNEQPIRILYASVSNIRVYDVNDLASFPQPYRLHFLQHSKLELQSYSLTSSMISCLKSTPTVK
jgi:hypothetical protein